MFKWLVLGYLLLVAKELYFMSGPPVCTALSRHCIPSLIPPFWTLSVDLSVQSSKYEYDPLPDCSFIVSFSNFTTLSPSYDHTCYLNLTAFHRRRTPERDLDPPTPIMANLDISYMNTLVKTIKVELSDVRPVRVGGRRTSTEYRDLLSAPTDITPSITPSQDVDATSQDVDATEEPTSGTYLVPYWRFTSYSPLTIVYTAAHHQTPKPPTNVVRTGLPTKNSLFYSPDIYFSDIATLSSSAIEIGPDPTDRPPVKLTITFAALSFLPSTVLRQTGLALTTFETLLSDIDPTVGAGVFDEIRYMLSPRYLYRFVLSNIISTLHVYLSFMAFKNDVGFYKGKSDMKGISASSLITSFISSFIIFLYLMDSGGTSSVVLLTIGVEVLIDLWKLSKILRPKFTPTFPFVNIYDPGARSAGEVETMDYDAIATKNLWLTLLPILIGSAMYVRAKRSEHISLTSESLCPLAPPPTCTHSLNLRPLAQPPNPYPLAQPEPTRPTCTPSSLLPPTSTPTHPHPHSFRPQVLPPVLQVQVLVLIRGQPRVEHGLHPRLRPPLPPNLHQLQVQVCQLPSLAGVRVQDLQHVCRRRVRVPD